MLLIRGRNDTTICINTHITLDAGPGGIQYYWNTGQGTQTIIAMGAGAYDVDVTTSNGCVGSDTIIITKTGYLPTVDGILTTNNGQYSFQFTAVNPQNVTAFDWDFGDGSTHSNLPAPIHTYPDDGDYIVVLRLSSICGFGQDTASAHIVGIHQINVSQDELTIYPNPSRTTATILNKGSLKMEHIEVYNVLGQIIYKSKAVNNAAHTINLDGIAAGLYTVQIYTDKGTIARKIEVIR